jgi:acyl phosphate:glycerol-3-phosphate acyltransferase
MTALLAALAYLIGSLSFAVIVSRAMNLPDPHSYGSGNPGATNVLRTGSKKAALLTLIGDGLKGAAAVWVARWILGNDASEPAIAAVAFAAFIGHLYPVYFRFKGGKGVATAAGIVFSLDWRLGILLLAVWMVVAATTRYSSLAALSAALAAPVAAWFYFGSSALTGAVLAIALLLVMRHAANIRKLLQGTESRIKLSRAGNRGPSGGAP